MTERPRLLVFAFQERIPRQVELVILAEFACTGKLLSELTGGAQSNGIVPVNASASSAPKALQREQMSFYFRHRSTGSFP